MCSAEEQHEHDERVRREREVERQREVKTDMPLSAVRECCCVHGC